MGIISVLLLSILSFVGPIGDLAVQSNEGPIEIKILIIPAFQSRVISGASQKSGEGGGVTGAVVGGNVTANFPDGYIILKATSDADHSEIQRLIKNKIASFPCSCGDFVGMNGYANHVIEFDPAAGKYERFEFHGSIHDRIITGEYFLYIEPIVVNQNKIWLNFEVTENLGPAQAMNGPNKYFKEELFNQIFKMGEDEILLVGFAPPKIEDRYRSSAYWFIIKKVEGYKNQ